MCTQPLPVSNADSSKCTPADLREKKLHHDLRVLAAFIEDFCKLRHDGPRGPVEIKGVDLEATVGRMPQLCPDCRMLLTHAFVKRIHCPMDPKPSCSKCPQHCYAPTYRSRIREVMRTIGWRRLLKGRFGVFVHFHPRFRLRSRR